MSLSPYEYHVDPKEIYHQYPEEEHLQHFLYEAKYVDSSDSEKRLLMVLLCCSCYVACILEDTNEACNTDELYGPKIHNVNIAAWSSACYNQQYKQQPLALKMMFEKSEMLPH